MKIWASRFTPTLDPPPSGNDPVYLCSVSERGGLGGGWGRVLGPLWGGYLYDLNMDFAFYSGAVMLAIGWVVSVLAGRNDAYMDPPTSSSDL